MFNRFSLWITHRVGTPLAFLFALLIIVVWAPTILFLEFDTWNFIINTTTTIITFLMVFVIQASQNRDTKALHAKLDVLIHALPDADNKWQRIEELPIQEIEAKREQIEE